MKNNNKIVEKVRHLYDWIDEQLRQNSLDIKKCSACGKCCDFENYDHRLFVTTLELFFFQSKMSPEQLKKSTKLQCPYNISGKCSVYENRFLGCRIFSCSLDADFQSSLMETALRRLKKICEDYHFRYNYLELTEALNNSNIYLPATVSCPADCGD